jgi:hypothetical protein
MLEETLISFLPRSYWQRELTPPVTALTEVPLLYRYCGLLDRFPMAADEMFALLLDIQGRCWR